MRRKGEKKLHIERADPGAYFVQAARQIVLTTSILEAYRRSSGMLLEEKRTALARETLAFEIQRCEQAFNRVGSVSDAHEHAGRWAMKSYLGNWWTCTPMDIPPTQLGPGDEFYNRNTVADIVERHRDFIPNIKG